MKKDGEQHEERSPAILVIVFIVLYAAVFASYAFNTGVVSILLYGAGSLFYLVYIKINSVGFRYNCDYIQSGEGAVALLAIVVTSLWIADTPSVVFPATAVSVFLFEIFVNRVIIKKGTESFTNGIYINITVALLLGFFLIKIPSCNAEFLGGILLGYGVLQGMDSFSLIPLFSLVCISALLTRFFKPELDIFSHGPGYFNTTGMNYSRLKFFLSFFRSVIFTITFLIIGVAGGALLYLRREGKGRQIQLEQLITALAYIQVMVMLTLFLNRNRVSAISIALSYAIFLVSQRKRKYLYDRS